jgi:cytochrome P450
MLVFMQRKENRPAGDEDNFIDNLADAVEQDPEFMSQDEALFLTLAGYFAGLDTVANVSSFMLYELLRHPEILSAVRAEADQVFADGFPDADSFRKMPTLHAVAQETFRLYPIAGALGRIAARDFEFAGYTIRKGEQFMVATAAPHFSTEFYAEPYSFDIERYHEPRNEHKKRGVFAPFGAGSHTCLGAGLAEVQIMLAAATILHYADFSMDPPNYKLKKVYTPSMTPKDFGIKFTAWRH